MTNNEQTIKKGKSQLIMKTHTSAEWAKCEAKYIPGPNIILVYQDDDKMPLFKFSDGKTLLRDLPFVNNTSIEQVKSAPTVEGSILT